MALKVNEIWFDPANANPPDNIGDFNYNPVTNRFEKGIDDGAGNVQVEQVACLSDITTSVQCGEVDLATFLPDTGDGGPPAGVLCVTVPFPTAFVGNLPKVVVSVEGEKDCVVIAQTVKGSTTLTDFQISLSTGQTFAAGEACVVWHAVQPV